MLKEQTHAEAQEEATLMDLKYDMGSFNKRFRKCQQLIRFKPTEKQLNPNKFTILSIDGGGFRDIIPIIFLMELEIRSKRNITSMFNMIGGTSFGAIIAACLTYPTLLNDKKPKFLTKDIMSYWNRQLPKIFSNDNLLSSNYRGYMYTIKLIQSAKGEPTYDGVNRNKIFETLFQRKTMDKAIRQLMIPAFDTSNGHTVWFDSASGIEAKDPGAEGSQNIKLKMNVNQVSFKDAVLASTTTPNLFNSLEYDGGPNE